MNKEYLSKDYILLFPALIAFLISSLLLFKYSTPISWDVFYHMHMINLYISKGLIFWDFSTVAPEGRLILYPPLFHLVLARICLITGITPSMLCWILQPIFSGLLIFVITVISSKLTNNKTGFITGFMALLSFSTFNRGTLCSPETVALMLFLISAYLFYDGFKFNKLKSRVISAILLGLIFNIHMATGLLLLASLSGYAIVLLYKRSINFKDVLCYGIIVVIVGCPWWIYIYLHYTVLLSTFKGNNILLWDYFFKYYGIIPTLCTLMGSYALVKKDNYKDIKVFLLSISLILLLLSQLHYLGFGIIPKRVLEVAAYPLIIIAGIGFSEIYKDIKLVDIKYIIVILFILLSSLSALMYTDSYTPVLMNNEESGELLVPYNIHLLIDPVGTYYKPTIISDRFGNSTLAHDRYNVMVIFKKENNRHIVVSEDPIMDTILVSNTPSRVVYGGFSESIPSNAVDPTHIIKGYSTKQELKDLSVGYIIIKSNTTTPYYSDMIYNNTNYKVCKIKSEYLK